MLCYVHWSQSWGPKVHGAFQPSDWGLCPPPPLSCSAANARLSKFKAWTGHTGMFICSGDLDLDPMTPIYDFDLGIPKLYLHTKNELYRSMRSTGKIIAD